MIALFVFDIKFIMVFPVVIYVGYRDGDYESVFWAVILNQSLSVFKKKKKIPIFTSIPLHKLLALRCEFTRDDVSAPI